MNVIDALRRGDDLELVVLVRNDDAVVRLEVEVLLAADAHL